MKILSKERRLEGFYCPDETEAEIQESRDERASKVIEVIEEYKREKEQPTG
ncbi:45130_t:CDS:2, partial [Gigaspora margarita]